MVELIQPFIVGFLWALIIVVLLGRDPWQMWLTDRDEEWFRDLQNVVESPPLTLRVIINDNLLEIDSDIFPGVNQEDVQAAINEVTAGEDIGRVVTTLINKSSRSPT
jgi:hypothetical protein